MIHFYRTANDFQIEEKFTLKNMRGQKIFATTPPEKWHYFALEQRFTLYRTADASNASNRVWIPPGRVSVLPHVLELLTISDFFSRFHNGRGNILARHKSATMDIK